ncbi:MAG: sialate O-acetylesterase, partial [Fidelibacterota bacterium]
EKLIHEVGQDGVLLYLLMGQSNMAGRGEVGAIDQQTHPRVFAMDAADEWISACEPVHFDKPHLCGTGPAMAFARIMADRHPAAKIGLIPCAMGGSTLQQWQRGSDLYQTAVDRARVAMRVGCICGMLWHQGESDAMQADTAQSYGGRLSRLIEDLRRDLDCPDLAVVVGQIGDFLSEQMDRKWTQVVNDALANLPSDISRCACVSASGLGHNEHDLHFNAAGSRELGERFAHAMLSLGTCEDSGIDHSLVPG